MRTATTSMLGLAILFSVATASDPASLERTVRRTVPTAGITRVELHIPNGDITVRGEQDGTEAAVAAELRVRAEGGGRPHWENQQIAERCLESMDIVTETRDSVLMVTYRASDAAGCSHSVSLDVSLPSHLFAQASTENGDVDVLSLSAADIRCANGDIELHGMSEVTAFTENGDIDAERLTGSATLRAGNGAIRAALHRAARQMDLRVTNGSVRVDVPEGASARLDAQVTTGKITHSGLPARSLRQVQPRRLQATLGDGAGSFVVRVSTGEITLCGR